MIRRHHAIKGSDIEPVLTWQRNRAYLRRALPLGWKQDVAEILQQQGKDYHNNTLTNALKPNARLTPANIDIYNACVEHMNSLVSQLSNLQEAS